MRSYSTRCVCARLVQWYTGNGRGYEVTLSSVCAGRLPWYAAHRTQYVAYVQIHTVD